VDRISPMVKMESEWESGYSGTTVAGKRVCPAVVCKLR
jgi:hypothetical protein